MATLDRLGYRASLKVVHDDYFADVQDSRTRAQIGFYGSFGDYPAASGFLHIFTCAAFVPASAGNVNAAGLCNASLDRAFSRALSRQAADAPGANTTWADVDRRAVELAPWVAVVNPRSVAVVSRRVGNYQFHPQWGVLFDQLWVR